MYKVFNNVNWKEEGAENKEKFYGRKLAYEKSIFYKHKEAMLTITTQQQVNYEDGWMEEIF
jgi:hypothetical protein